MFSLSQRSFGVSISEYVQQKRREGEEGEQKKKRGEKEEKKRGKKLNVDLQTHHYILCPTRAMLSLSLYISTHQFFPLPGDITPPTLCNTAWCPALMRRACKRRVSVIVGESLSYSVAFNSTLHINTFIHTYTHTYIHTYTYTHIHTYMHTHTYIYTHIHTCIHTHIHTHTSTIPSLPSPPFRTMKVSQKHSQPKLHAFDHIHLLFCAMIHPKNDIPLAFSM